MTHNPIQHIKFLRQILSQGKKPIGFFISAGCPFSIKVSEDKEALIPDVRLLTKFIRDEFTKDALKSKPEEPNNFEKILAEVICAKKKDDNIEDILSFLRGLKEVSMGASVRGFDEKCLSNLEKAICDKIVAKLDVNLPNKETPYHKLAQWISIDREKPIEVFTTNYDLLLEEAFEYLSVPYFDGFVGSRQSFFDLRAVENNQIPKHWTRLWKIHGSINWFQKDNKEVYRSSRTKENEGSCLIYPSHLKYEESRKMPYLALLDQLNRFLRQPNSLMIMSGYSFNDEHLNDTILNALKANPNSMVIALLFETLDGKDAAKEPRYSKAIKLAESRNNFAIWSSDEAIIGTVKGKWKIPADMEEEKENIVKYIYNDKISPIGKGDDKDDKHLLKLGDFCVLGDFLQDLIGYSQAKLYEE